MVNFQKLGVDTHMTVKMHIFYKDSTKVTSKTFKKNHTYLIFFKNSYTQNLNFSTCKKFHSKKIFYQVYAIQDKKVNDKLVLYII